MSIRFTLSFLALLATAILAPSPAPANDAPATSTLTVKGDVATPLTLTIEDIKKSAPAVTIETVLKEKPYKVVGVPLSAVLEKSGLKVDPKAKHPEAGFIVLASGRDGYVATFAWPELMADVGAKAAYVVWEANGKPLDAKDGPLRLVVPSDKKPMRWVFGLASLEIRDGKKVLNP